MSWAGIGETQFDELIEKTLEDDIYLRREKDWDNKISPKDYSVVNSFPKKIRKSILKYHSDVNTGKIKNLLTAWKNSCLKEDKNSLFLYGDTGTGKTVLACAVANSWMRERYIMTATYVPFKIMYNVYDFVSKIKSFYAKNNQQETTEYEFLQKLETQPLLILDDLGVEKGSEWEMFMLYGLINNRSQEGLPTIYTSNYSLEELSCKMSNDRIVSRIMLTSTIIKCDGFEEVYD